MTDMIPSYLTKEFLKSTLENGLKIFNVAVEDFSVSLASGKGENYTSEILRVCVNYKHVHKKCQQFLILKNVMEHLVIDKSMFEDIKDTVNIMDIIENEIVMYTEVFPQIEKLLGNSTMFAPKIFGAHRKERILVLEDLKALGYEVENRITGLDEEHCIVVMKKIAQFHAGSMCVAKKNLKYKELFNNSLFESSMQSDMCVKFFLFNFEQMINVARAWPDYEKIVEKLEKISRDLMRKGFEHCQRKEGELQVINHGDLWVNNMMFKRNTDKSNSLDVAFVDLQITYYGSLGIDLNYFFNTSVQIEVLKSKRNKLVKIYYETLRSSLEKLKYSPIPSWEEVCKEVRAKELFGLLTLGTIFPVTCMDKSVSQNNTFDTMLENSEEKVKAMFSSDRMKETLKYSLKRFHELGVLDE